MKIIFTMLGITLLVACDKKPHTDRDDLVTEWSQDGKVMMVIRKGVMIASFRNASNACSIDLSGPDGLADTAISYYEGDTTSGGSERKNIVLAWSQNDGSIKTVAYDNEGNIMPPNELPKTK